MQTRYDPTDSNIARCMESAGTYHFTVYDGRDLALLRSRLYRAALRNKKHVSTAFDDKKEFLKVKVTDQDE